MRIGRIAPVMVGMMAVGIATAVAAKPPHMKMSTKMPKGIAIPDELDTPIGELRFFDGVPDEKTAQKVYDNLDLQRAVQAYLSSIQIASMSGMRSRNVRSRVISGPYKSGLRSRNTPQAWRWPRTASRSNRAAITASSCRPASARLSPVGPAMKEQP